MLNITPRIGMVVWVYSLKQIRALRHFGTVMYVSKRMKYAYLYLDADQADAVKAEVEKLRFVKSVVLSKRPELAEEYGPDADTAMNRLIAEVRQQGGQNARDHR